MLEWVKKVQSVCQQQFLQADFVVGLSGGVDSVVLLHLFAQTSAKVRAIHIHHGLSPNADSWADFCQSLCQRWQIPLAIKHICVQGSQGLEANARVARYQAFKEEIRPNEVLVTAHHLDDQAETFLLALKRGSGVKGLSAMQAVSFQQNLTLFRPLLAVSKAELLAYAKAHQLDHIEDESNRSNAFERNFLRNQILPLLQQRWQHFNQMVARSAAHCAEQQQLLEELLAAELARLADFSQKSLDVGEFGSFSQAKQKQLLRLWLDKCGVEMPSLAQVERILVDVVFAQADRQPQFKLADWGLRRYQQRLWLISPLTEIQPFIADLLLNQSVILPASLGTLHYEKNVLIYKTAQQTHRFPLPQGAEMLPLQVKIGQQGKVARFGKPHREEMKKIWQQHNVPTWLRSQTPLIFINEQLWLVLPLVR